MAAVGPARGPAAAGKDREGRARRHGGAFAHPSSVSKSYPGVKALQDVSLEVEAGTVHAIMGENGAGKSTLMQIIAGAQRPSAGGLDFEGESLQLAGRATPTPGHRHRLPGAQPLAEPLDRREHLPRAGTEDRARLRGPPRTRGKTSRVRPARHPPRSRHDRPPSDRRAAAMVEIAKCLVPIRVS